MRALRVYKTDAIVLRHRDMGEADRVLTLFTPLLGKFDAVAKGVRRPSSRKRGHVELLAHTSLLIARGRNLDIVTQSQLIEPFAPLREDLQRLSRALYVAELTERFSAEGSEQMSLFRLLLETLYRLSERDDLDLVGRYFEMHLLQCTGYQPQLQRCTDCRAALDPVLNYFSVTAGGAVCSACRLHETAPRPLTVNALKVMRLLQAVSFADAARIRLTPQLAGEIEDHLRVSIRHILEREVRSAGFLQTVRRAAAAVAVGAGEPGVREVS